MPEASPTPAPKSDIGTKLTKADLAELRSAAIPTPTGWRRLSPVTILFTAEGVRVRVAWKQAVVAMIVLLIFGWFSAASGLYLFVKYSKDFPEVKFGHMLLFPLKSQREEYRKARGDFLIEQTQKMLEAGKIDEALHSLRVGAALSPHNRDGRMLLSQYYVIRGRPDLAQTHLIEGVEAHSDSHEYLQTTFNFLLQRQADFELVNITDQLLAKAGPSPVIDERLRLIAMARANAQFFRGNYDASEDTLREFRLNESTEGKLLGIKIAWERGERDTALDRLEILSSQTPENEKVYAQHSAYLREAGRDNDLRRLALLRQLSYPERPRARIDLLYIYDKTKDETSVRSGIADVFRDFSDNGEVMVALADFAANTGRPELARRIYDLCKAANLPWEGAALMTVEAHVVAGQYREALAATIQMQEENPEWGKRFASVFNGLQAIANFGLSDVEGAELFLSNFLNQSGVRADNLVAVSNRLLTIGANTQARQVLAQAVRSDPLNQTALTGLIRLEIEAGQADAVAGHLRTLLTMRKPPHAILRKAYDKLASDRFIFTPGRSDLLDELRKTLDTGDAGTGKG